MHTHILSYIYGLNGKTAPTRAPRSVSHSRTNNSATISSRVQPSFGITRVCMYIAHIYMKEKWKSRHEAPTILAAAAVAAALSPLIPPIKSARTAHLFFTCPRALYSPETRACIGIHMYIYLYVPHAHIYVWHTTSSLVYKGRELAHACLPAIVSDVSRTPEWSYKGARGIKLFIAHVHRHTYMCVREHAQGLNYADWMCSRRQQEGIHLLPVYIQTHAYRDTHTRSSTFVNIKKWFSFFFSSCGFRVPAFVLCARLFKKVCAFESTFCFVSFS